MKVRNPDLEGTGDGTFLGGAAASMPVFAMFYGAEAVGPPCVATNHFPGNIEKPRINEPAISNPEGMRIFILAPEFQSRRRSQPNFVNHKCTQIDANVYEKSGFIFAFICVHLRFNFCFFLHEARL